MKEKTEKEIVDIKNLREVKKSLEEEITKLQKIQNNLEAQSHTAQIKGEQDDKIKNAERMTKYALEEDRIESKRIAIEVRIDTAETLERKLNDREREVEKREQRTLDLENKLADLNNQRSNFENYKVSINAQLDQAKETIAESQEIFDKIDAEKAMLAGREAAVKVQEKIWNDEIGKLEADKKAFQLEKENLIGLNSKKEE